MNITPFIGTIGASCILIAFCLNRFKILERDSRSYDMMNICGGLLLVLYAWLLGSVPFFVLNSVWSGAALVALVQNIRSRKNHE